MVAGGGGTDRGWAIVGVDMAAQKAHTAMAKLRFDPSGELGLSLSLSLKGGVDDAGLEEVLRDDRSIVAIDAPLGWPVDFVKAVNGWGRAEGREWTGDRKGEEAGGKAERKGFEHLKLRRTDVAAGRQGVDGRGANWPLPYSVAADKIAVTTFRTLGVLHRAYPEVDITGRTGRVLEVWPGASLAAFGFDARGYKGTKRENRESRERVVKDVAEQCRAGLQAKAWLTGDTATSLFTDENVDLLKQTDHMLDAFVAAITAWAVFVDLGIGPGAVDWTKGTAGQLESEGWIYLPNPDAVLGSASRIEEVMARDPRDGVSARIGHAV